MFPAQIREYPAGFRLNYDRLIYREEEPEIIPAAPERNAIAVVTLC